MQFVRYAAVGLVAIIAAGCQAQNQYHWGSYPDITYIGFAEPGKLPPQEQIKSLEADIRAADKEHKALPPGFHAHLGYLYAKIGNKDAAKANFEEEKRAFPESAVLMDRLLANLARS